MARSLVTPCSIKQIKDPDVVLTVTFVHWNSKQEFLRSFYASETKQTHQTYSCVCSIIYECVV